MRHPCRVLPPPASSSYGLPTHGETRAGIEQVRGEIHQAVVGQTRWLIGYITAWSGVVLALAKVLS